MEIIFKLSQGEYPITVIRREGTHIAVSGEYRLPPDRVFSEVRDFKQKQVLTGKRCSNCGENLAFDSW